jgi:hypothetical protein
MGNLLYATGYRETCQAPQLNKIIRLSNFSGVMERLMMLCRGNTTSKGPKAPSHTTFRVFRLSHNLQIPGRTCHLPSACYLHESRCGQYEV